MKDDNNGRWHLDKRVSWGHVITTLTVVVAGIVWLLRLEGRVDLVEAAISHNVILIEHLVNQQSNEYKEVIRRLERIEDKLDSKKDKLAANGIN